MNLRFQHKDKTLIVGISGELDHHSSEAIRIKIDNKIDELGIMNLIIDFSDVNFMDSSGIGVIIGRYRRIAEFGGKLLIVNLKPQIRKVFELGGLFKIVKEYKNIDEAAANL